MQILPLIQVASQEFTFRDGDTRWTVRLKDCGDVMAATILRDEAIVVSGVRALPGEFLIPFVYLETGNFMFVTEGDELPSGPMLGRGQELYYFDAAEMVDLRNG